MWQGQVRFLRDTMVGKEMPPMTLETCKLGSQESEFTTIGFGAWVMGDSGWAHSDAHSWGPRNDHDFIEAVHVALDQGINWDDTAAVYGLVHSEEVLGRTLRIWRQNIVLSTKLGLVWDKHRTHRQKRQLCLGHARSCETTGL
jgi:aryl-alcohol dehydrogenase-like predicted oxidoreductase